MSVTAIGALAKQALTAFAAYKAFGDKNQSNKVTEGVSEMAANSIIELGQAAEMEFITVIDSSLTSHESTTDVLKYINSLCAGWVLAAASVNTDVGKIKTTKLLGKLNPSKTPSIAIANTILNGAASMASAEIEPSSETVVIPNKLPTTTASLESLYSYSDTGFEAVSVGGTGGAQQPAGNAKPKDPLSKLPNASEHTDGMRSGTDLVTVQNLSIGQMVTMTITDGKASKDVNITIRLITIPTSPKLLKTILSWSQQDNRLKSRIRAWKTGELRFWRDVVLMRDIFTERKRILMNDNSDLLATMLGRSRDSMVHSVLTATPSVGTLSSVLVISADTLMDIERRELDGRLKDFKYRQRIMNATGIMLIVVVDPISELVTVYTHTKSIASEFSIRQMKAAGKGGNDITEILKLMNQNSAASF